MKPTLHVYACSLGMYGTVDIIPHEWFNEDSFGWVLAKKLGYNINNRSQPGGCNFNIFQRCMEDIRQRIHKPDDIVICQFTSIDRAWTSGAPLIPGGESSVHETYYKYMHNDLQSMAMLIGFNLILKKLLPCKFYFSLINDFKTLKNINQDLFNTIVNDESFMNLGNGVWAYFGDLNDQKYFVSPTDSHFSKLAHEFVAEKYFEKITGKHSLPEIKHDVIEPAPVRDIPTVGGILRLKNKT